MPYSERLAESYLAAKEAERANGTTEEDPLFKQIAGDSKEFVGGIPKETWDGMSDEQRKSLVHGTDEDRQKFSEFGTAIGGGIGAIASIPAYAAGPVVGGVTSAVLTGYGGARGYNAGWNLPDKLSPPSPISREVLKQQYESTKGRE